jgi:F0F1-type ATP synthase assembly protein I
MENQEMKDDIKEKATEGKKAVNSYLKYSGLGFQIAGTLAAGVFLGYWLDKWFKTQQPYFMLACSFTFLIAGMYLGFRDFLKKN